MSDKKWMFVLLPLAVLIGLGIAYVDSRPTWDDTAVLVVALLAGSALFGALGPRWPWLWALAVGIWIPLNAIITRQDFSMLIVLAFPLVGAYLGMAARRLLLPPKQSPNQIVKL